MVQLMPLLPETPSSLASFKSRLVLPYWYQLTQVVLEKKPLNGCSSSSSSYEMDSILITTIISNAVHYWYTAEKNWKTKFGVENRKWNTHLHLLCLQNDCRCNSEAFELVSDLQQEAQLSLMHRVSRNLANYHATVHYLYNKSWTNWTYEVGR